MFDLIIAGFMDSLTIANLLFVLLGVTLGMIAGAVPGVNGPMAIALCVPLSYYMSPMTAIGFLVGLNKGAFYGGAISGVLLNTPGTPEAAATSWDGYPLSKQGKGEKALRMALYGSVSGDFFATWVLILVAAPLAAVALYMGPPEIFALICLAMTIIAGIGSSSMTRGLIAAALGIFIGTIGMEPVSALPRLTFGLYQLERGIALIPIGIGMLAFSEIIIQLERSRANGAGEATLEFSKKPEDRFVSFAEFRRSIKTIFRSSIAGTIVGAMPGLGAPVASFFAYDRAKKASKNPENYGKGELDGIVASESANSAVCASALIPLFTLGIPGNVASALLIGAFVIHGMIPGPLMFEQNARFIYSIYSSLIMANIFLLVVGRLGLRASCKAVSAPKTILYPIIIFTCLMGSYLGAYNTFDVILMLFFAFLAYFMNKWGFSHICFIIGFILSPIWETALQQVIIVSQLDTFMFFKRPVAVILMIITFYIVIKTTINTFKKTAK
ncbi:MAG: tripartite tricarboxylate transporter permease [Deltaproteobacteria bacterium]|jgi:putative tricarboxylic transport membrane protein|nr:tripartite tricarboxylate transporter permease [Deltaproteobacteria bacterium]